MNKLQKTEIYCQLVDGDESEAAELLRSHWGMEPVLEGTLSDLYEITYVLNALLKIHEEIFLHGDFEAAERKGHDFMRKQESLKRLKTIYWFDVPALRAVYHTDIRGLTYRVLTGDIAPKDFLPTISNLIEALKGYLS